MGSEINVTVEQDKLRWQRVVEREHTSDFIYAVCSTNIYCRPGCPARLPARNNVRFFDDTADAASAGFRPCRRCRPDEREQTEAAVEQVCAYIDSHLDDPLTLNVLGSQAGLSPGHLQRIFLKKVGVTPRKYVAALRLERFKAGLRDGEAVGSAMIEAGYGSTSRVYENSDKTLGMKPRVYQKGGAAMNITYAVGESSLGSVLVASTNLGICSITIGDSEDELVQRLSSEYPAASILRDSSALADQLSALLKNLDGRAATVTLPLDIQATAFQHMVWQELQRIPIGETRTYAQVAESIGKPKSVRAVANACAANQVALAIPCHRVVRTDGGIGGYRWGEERKKELLSRESAGAKKG